MDVRLTSEQQQLRDAAAKLADDLGPGAVGELDDGERVARLEKTVAATGWRSLRSDGASGVEVALVAEEFGRGLVDVPFLGPVLADDLGHGDATVVFGAIAPDARGLRMCSALAMSSLPVPFSPWMSTLALLGATASTSSNSSRITSLWPMTAPMPSGSRSLARSCSWVTRSST